VLVLDDYHLITHKTIHQGLAFLLENQPTQLHLVLSTRADPPLPIFRLRARNQLTELRDHDLRFTESEAAGFLREIMSLVVSTDDVKALEARTEGWIAGLQLAAISMQGKSDLHQFVSDFTGGHHYILEYLTEEVVNQQPAEVQQFLHQTAILNRLSGPLCDTVCQTESGASETILQHLQHHNLFIIPLDSSRQWVRYHHLFADLLKNILRRTVPQTEINLLHHRAAEWFRQNDLVEEALHHAFEAQAFDLAADLLMQKASSFISLGRIDHLLTQIERLPMNIIHAQPSLRLHQGWALFLNGQYEQAEKVLEDTQDSLTELVEDTGLFVLRAKLNAAQAIIATLQHNPLQAIDKAQQALQELPKDDLIWRSRANRALGTAYGLTGDTQKMVAFSRKAQALALAGQNLFLAADIMSQIASAQFHCGRLFEAGQSYQEIIDLVATPAQFPPAGVGWAGLAEINLEWNKLAVAEEQIKRSIDLFRRGGIGHNLQNAYGVQAVIYQALEQPEAAQTALRLAKQIYQQGRTSPFLAVSLVVYQTRVHRLQGDDRLAYRCILGEDLSPPLSFENFPQVLREVQQVELGRVYLRQGKPDEVMAIHQQCYAAAKTAGRLARVVELDLLKAMAMQQKGLEAEAMDPLAECLSLAQPANYTRLFLEAGSSLTSLLEDALSRNITPNYTRKLLTMVRPSSPTDLPTMAHKTPADEKSPPLLDPLTNRELEVIQLINRGYTNRQIADALVVTLNTVKKHTSHIYSKLGVKNRTKALLKARELKLL
jgi:LuxR family maltose regulon positive regulatory protein